MKNLFDTICLRFKAQTPLFFSSIVKIGLCLGVIGTGLALASVTFPSVLPAFVVKLAGYLITGGVTTAGVAKLTVDDPKVLKTANELLKTEQ
jgi:ABC-type xylose transport system permease subunit